LPQHNSSLRLLISAAARCFWPPQSFALPASRALSPAFAARIFSSRFSCRYAPSGIAENDVISAGLLFLFQYTTSIDTCFSTLRRPITMISFHLDIIRDFIATNSWPHAEANTDYNTQYAISPFDIDITH